MKKNGILGGIFWKLSERVLAQVVSFIVSIVLARILLPEDYGIVSIVIIFITFADVFVSSGFGTSLIQKKDADHLDFNSIFYSSLLVSIFIYIILWFVSPIIANFYNLPLLKSVIRIFSIRIIISAYNTVQHAYVSRNMQFKKFFLSTLFGTILSGVVGIIMAINGYGVWSLVAQYLTNTIVDSIILTFTIEWKPKLEYSLIRAKFLMKYGWKVLASDLSGTFFDQLRSLIIGKIYTPADLSYYNKGKQIPSLISDNLSVSIMSVLFPAFSNEGDNVARIKDMTKKATKVLCFISLPILFALSAMSKSIILILLTDKWFDSIIFMELLSITCAISMVSGVSLQCIKAVGRSDILLKLEIYKKPIYLLLLVLGAFFGVKGIAVTGLMYAVYSGIINCVSMGKLINYSMIEQIKDVYKSMILGIIIFIFLYIINLLNVGNIATLIVQSVLAVVIAIVAVPLFFKDEFNTLKSRFPRRLKGGN